MAAIPEGTGARGTQLELVPISLTLTSRSISRSLSTIFFDVQRCCCALIGETFLGDVRNAG